MEIRQKLQYYVTLQLLLDQRRAARHRLEHPPKELKAHQQHYAEKQQALRSKRQEVEKLKKEQAELQQEVESLQKEREHFRKQKGMVTNMRQLQAVVSELDHVEGEIKIREDKLLSIWQSLESLEKELATLSEETEEERKAREKLEDLFAEQRRQAEKELEIIKTQLSQVQKLLSNDHWEEFKKLWSSRKPTVIVPLDGDACSECHAQLRPSLLQAVRSATELAFCDSCRRLLYDPAIIQPLKL